MRQTLGSWGIFSSTTKLAKSISYKTFIS